jgi:hypothetical protein
MILKPETTGYPVSFEPVACRFDTWLGDDIVRAHPLLLVTSRLRRSLLRLPNASGFSFDPVRVSTSPFFRQGTPGRRLPRFWHLVVHGRPGNDDMATLADHSLVVSLRVVQTLLAFSLREAAMFQYRPTPRSMNGRTRRRRSEGRSA